LWQAKITSTHSHRRAQEVWHSYDFIYVSIYSYNKQATNYTKSTNRTRHFTHNTPRQQQRIGRTYPEGIIK